MSSPKLAYLINESESWDPDEVDWRFYTEKDVPHWKLEYNAPRTNRVKRIVYFEIDEPSA